MDEFASGLFSDVLFYYISVANVSMFSHNVRSLSAWLCLIAQKLFFFDPTNLYPYSISPVLQCWTWFSVYSRIVVLALFGSRIIYRSAYDPAHKVPFCTCHMRNIVSFLSLLCRINLHRIAHARAPLHTVDKCIRPRAIKTGEDRVSLTAQGFSYFIMLPSLPPTSWKYPLEALPHFPKDASTCPAFGL